MYMPQIDQVILLQPVVILLVLFDFNYQYGFTACSFLLLIFLPIYDCVSSDTFWKGGEYIIPCVIEFLIVVGGSNPLKGDILVIAGATLYAVTNVSEVNN